MPQNLLDVPDRAAVEQQLRRGRMPQQVRGDLFVDAGELSVSRKRPPDIWPSQPGPASQRHEERSMIVRPGIQIPLDPLQGTHCEEHGAMLVILADDSRLPAFEINVCSIER